jgi:hypothetical protein
MPPLHPTARHSRSIFPPLPASARKRRFEKQPAEGCSLEADEETSENDSPKPKRPSIRPGPVLGAASSGSILNNTVSVDPARGSLVVKKGLSGMKALTDALTEIKISITSLKSRASELELKTMPVLEKNVNEAIKIGEEVREHIMILRAVQEELASTVENQENDLVKMKARMEHVKGSIGELYLRLEEDTHIDVKAIRGKRKSGRAKPKPKKDTPNPGDATDLKVRRNNAFNVSGDDRLIKH